jgi:putative transposase
MCRLLEVSRSYFYKVMKFKDTITAFKQKQNSLDKAVLEAFEVNYEIYGCNKIAIFLNKYHNLGVSKYQVLNSMKRQKLDCVYNKKKKKRKPYKIDTNNEKTPNILGQKFEVDTFNKVVTSDLTYVDVSGKFIYICFLLDLYNREIVGYNVSTKHNTDTVLSAFDNSNINLSTLELFHSDRGGEFKGSKLIDFLKNNKVKQSLSKAGYPYDNACSEKLFDIFKREWMKDKYDDIVELKKDVDEFVYWYNYFRLHGSIEYQTPVEKRLKFSQMKNVY